jgi:flavin reductase (DIM6/NTAB) family NADH-FMN oxidoreductase RutF
MKEIEKHDLIEWCSPYPYVLVTTIDKNQRTNIMGVCWWTFLSMDPFMMGISVRANRYTYECLEHCGEFVACFPSEGQEKGAWLCGVASGRNVDKSKETGFDFIPSKFVKPPIIEGATAAIECKVTGSLTIGDHDFFYGNIVSTHGDDQKLKHIYSIHYRKLVSISCRGESDFNLDFK